MPRRLWAVVWHQGNRAHLTTKDCTADLPVWYLYVMCVMRVRGGLCLTANPTHRTGRLLRLSATLGSEPDDQKHSALVPAGNPKEVGPWSWISDHDEPLCRNVDNEMLSVTRRPPR